MKLKRFILMVLVLPVLACQKSIVTKVKPTTPVGTYSGTFSLTRVADTQKVNLPVHLVITGDHFNSGSPGSKYYRVGGGTVTGNGTLLVFENTEAFPEILVAPSQIPYELIGLNGTYQSLFSSDSLVLRKQAGVTNYIYRLKKE